MPPTDIQQINIHEAKTHLSRIIEEVKTLHTPVIIAKAGKPQVKIVPLDDDLPASRFGFMPKQNVPDDFDTLFADEIQVLFGGDGT
ncbi:prevent-host-death family protein [Neisseria sp. HSC-16F19]|nr:type II toxin-antitoxin system prevent-host-death family antitoxin [Neisseria sp. HSC-16F19]MCP2040773.1 prevent-host-death family protein [Neisseria sp. HSC-16F19]